MPALNHSIRRLVPDEPFPAYAYVPGKFPHPTRSTMGHSAGQSHSAPAGLDPKHWQQCRTYLWGIDLFNHGYYWEAHEAWESLWHVAGRQGAVAEFLKGLIALAAAGVKAREGRVAGVKQHAHRARRILASLLAQTRIEERNAIAGLNVSALIEEAQSIADSPGPAVNTAHCPVAVVFQFRLLTEDSTI